MRTFFIDHISDVDTLPLTLSNGQTLNEQEYQVFVTIRLEDPCIYDMVSLVVNRPNFWVSRHSSAKVKDILAHRYQDKDRKFDEQKAQERAEAKQAKIRELKRQLKTSQKNPTAHTHQLRMALERLQRPEPPKPMLTPQQMQQRNSEFIKFLKQRKQALEKKLAEQEVVVARY